MVEKKFELKPQEVRRALLSDWQDQIINGGAIAIDTRTKPEFMGECHDYQPRKGRLPGSVSVPFGTMFDSNRKYVSRDQYLNRLPAASPKPIVTYCEVGVRAATVSLLHEIYTGEIIPVYDGSIMEWALDPSLPML
jgi:thiosulfate/3-mercaptopyruvate sulfurtransferase